MGFSPFRRAHGVQGSGVVPTMTQVVAVDMGRMRQTQVVCSIDQCLDHLPRGNIERVNLLIDLVDGGIFISLPLLIPARTHQLDGIRLACIQPPGDRFPELLHASLLQHPMEETVVTHQDVISLIKDGCILQLFQNVTST